ncbi:unannotated protein [freshwater metagenome]|uniref:Unannotated protein n=1 Tax=freshwater metagenome TaxID=449393 RepID=A0A6J7JLE8_9ZZZZ|nr:FAD-dependent oxidoreductase [Actinomycetota bacterium]
MFADEVQDRAQSHLDAFRVPDCPIFLIGTFDKGITVLSQQVRALNLVWSLIEGGEVGVTAEGGRKKIAIVGAGFAGLTVAAALLKKRVNADITIFERRDTVLPLQHGSDSRWLHPHIYEWPRGGSEAYSAALPVLNWTASRASDVVVQVLGAWENVVNAGDPTTVTYDYARPGLTVYCNTQHLQVSRTVPPPAADVEWIGERREPAEPSVSADGPASEGSSAPFDFVVMATGFGIETGESISYWRNETLAQPHLGQARSTYIVSGSGDGAMIDLFRLRIAHFRQDRILSELFSGYPGVLRELRELCEDPVAEQSNFNALDQLWARPDLTASTKEILDRLRDRLRHDTHVLLRVKNPSFAGLFIDRRVSFQNRLLAYLLYRAGGFTPTTGDLSALALEHSVPDDRVIVRHGTQKTEVLKSVLANGLHDAIDRMFKDSSRHNQLDEPAWSGGYFDMPARREEGRDNVKTADTVKSHWRKEYLPSPVEAIATVLASSVAGYILESTGTKQRLRVTLHRTLRAGDETVLQQCCQYQGLDHDPPERHAGRTFPVGKATIGAAYSLQKIVRTSATATAEQLETDMKKLELNDASREMSKKVRSVVAIPLLRNGPQHETHGLAMADRGPTVIGVLYIDSFDPGLFDDLGLLRVLRQICESFLGSLLRLTETEAQRIANTRFWTGRSQSLEVPIPPQSKDLEALEALEDPAPPTTTEVSQINFDFSDFVPVEDS